MSRSLSFSRQPAVHQYFKGANTLQSGHQVKQASKLYSASCENLTNRVSTLGQTSLVPFRRHGCAYPLPNRKPLIPLSLRLGTPCRATHINIKESIVKQKPGPFGTAVIGNVWKIGGGTALVFAAAFGGTYMYCENHTEGEFCSQFRGYLGLKKN